ncbi:MAG: energy transducer TonB [Deltaproteobacteria bacterium]|nr:energy transducer TonB [Deltaproteobacteria bacterium]
MKTKGLLSVLFLMFILLSTTRAVRGEEGPMNEPLVTQRVIVIEGTVEKPRVMFIVSRSRLWKGDSLEKSFIPELLAPIHHKPLPGDDGIAPKGGNTQGRGAASGKDINGYTARIFNSIRRNTYYPLPARESGMEGRVITAFRVESDGNISAIKVKVSSGFTILDAAALKIIEKSLPLPSPPAGGLMVEVPLVFSLKDPRQFPVLTGTDLTAAGPALDNLSE